jgi:hypothetical protein
VRIFPATLPRSRLSLHSWELPSLNSITCPSRSPQANSVSSESKQRSRNFRSSLRSVASNFLFSQTSFQPLPPPDPWRTLFSSCEAVLNLLQGRAELNSNHSFKGAVAQINSKSSPLNVMGCSNRIAPVSKHYRYTIPELYEISTRIDRPYDLSRLSFNAVRGM